MEIGKLTVQARDEAGKGISRQMRMNGMVPGICYGAGIDEPLKIAVNPKELKASLDPDKRTNTVLTVTVERNGKAERTLTTMLWDYQIHPIRREVTHVDLKAIDPNKAVLAEVPVELVGRAKGLVNGGQLNVARHSIEIMAKPADIPARFDLDVSELDLGDVLHVSDLVLPDTIELLTSGSLTIVTCLAPKGGVEEAAPAEAAAAAEPKKEEPKKEG